MEGEIQHLRAALLHREQDHGLVQLQLQEEKEERERAERKVDGLTRLMLEAHKGGDEETDATPKRRDNRRDTWAPGVIGALPSSSSPHVLVFCSTFAQGG